MPPPYNSEYIIFKIPKKKYLLFLADGRFLEIDHGLKQGIFEEGEFSACKAERYFHPAGLPAAPKRKKFSRSRETGMRGVELLLSNKCNMSCSYCYRRKNEKDYNTRKKKGDMSWTTAKRALDRLLEHNKGLKQPVYVIFFGGEPFLNMKVLKKSLRYIARKQKTGLYPLIRTTVCTNGTLLKPEFIEILTRYNCSVRVSIDACEESHNKNRPYRNGRPSYPGILKGIKNLRKNAPGLPITLYPTFNLNDKLEGVFELHRKIKTCGVNIRLNFSVYDDSKVTKKDFYRFLESIRKEMEKIFRESLENKEPFNVISAGVFFRLLSGTVAELGCGAGERRVTIDSEGDIFMCSLFLDSGEKLGNPDKGIGLRERKAISDAYERFYLRMAGCKKCWARRLCRGLCVHTRARPSAVYGNNRSCDFVRLLTEFSLKNYYLMTRYDALRLFGIKPEHKDIFKKINMLYDLREMRNYNLKGVKYITPF